MNITMQRSSYHTGLNNTYAMININAMIYNLALSRVIVYLTMFYLGPDYTDNWPSI